MSEFDFKIRTPISRVRGLGSAKSGTEHFWRQRLTAIANIPLVLSFVIIVALMPGSDFGSARALIGQPLVAILLLLLVISVTIHMRIGMQVIIEDYVHGGAKVVAVLANTFFAIIVAASAIFAVLKIAFGM
ncbi:succinate dehydrogenase, hydrophobic membrane anchor protein [Chelatococcus sp. GCM10030263]|uniref:succinate dehydrogenase, hydrophobic membrane anchor protein n=1 Tax=Chelatococcus sp. GCM10030263 TaxID=3273387 RepID=UPI0036232346